MRREEGFSLTEMLLAICITLLVLAGTLGAFHDSLRLHEKAVEVSELDHNLRTGMQVLVEDFVGAGWGIPIGGVPIPSGEDAEPVTRPGPRDGELEFASETIASVNPGPALGPRVCGGGTDMVNILSADGSIALDTHRLVEIGENGSIVTVDPRTPISGPHPVRSGDLICLSNALGSALQYVTRVSGQKILFDAGDPMRLNQPGVPGSVTRLMDEEGHFPPTSARRIHLITYYLEPSPLDPGLTRLMRRINDRPATAVAEVLENLQFSYDLVDGALNPTDIKIPLAPNSPAQIRKVNILLAGRTGRVMRETGTYVRRTLTTQVSLRSLSYIDRYR